MAAKEHNATTPAAHPGHLVPLRVLVATLVALLLLTFLTVAATAIDLGGSLNLWLAMIIATIKATLVALYFMHLRYDKPFIAIILIAALLFVLLFVGLTLLDTVQYHADVQSWRDVDPSRYAPELDQR